MNEHTTQNAQALTKLHDFELQGGHVYNPSLKKLIDQVAREKLTLLPYRVCLLHRGAGNPKAKKGLGTNPQADSDWVMGLIEQTRIHASYYPKSPPANHQVKRLKQSTEDLREFNLYTETQDEALIIAQTLEKAILKDWPSPYHLLVGETPVFIIANFKETQTLTQEQYNDTQEKIETLLTQNLPEARYKTLTPRHSGNSWIIMMGGYGKIHDSIIKTLHNVHDLGILTPGGILTSNYWHEGAIFGEEAANAFPLESFSSSWARQEKRLLAQATQKPDKKKPKL